MNERIKELAYQTKLKTGALPGSEKWQTVFAELIVRECAQWMIDNKVSDSTYEAARMLEHFGVE